MKKKSRSWKGIALDQQLFSVIFRWNVFTQISRSIKAFVLCKHCIIENPHISNNRLSINIYLPAQRIDNFQMINAQVLWFYLTKAKFRTAAGEFAPKPTIDSNG